MRKNPPSKRSGSRELRNMLRNKKFAQKNTLTDAFLPARNALADTGGLQPVSLRLVEADKTTNCITKKYLARSI